MPNSKFQILNSLILLFLLVPLSANAAILYLEPSESTHNLGDTFIQEIRLDTQGEYINAAEIHIEYLQDMLEVRDFSKGNSVLTLWAEEPSFEGGVLSFVGGIPAGFQGWDGLLGKIIFRVKSKVSLEDAATSTTTEVKFLETSRVLLNDGEGTEAALFTEDVVLTILPEFSSEPKDEWEQQVATDNISPEPFDVEISNNSSVYGGKYFIIFSAVDKQAGIDHYEVLEYWEGKTSENKNAHSPYLLENQKLSGIIRVRAVDEAGNEAIVEIRPTGVEEEKGFPWRWVIFGILIGTVIGAVGYWIYRRFLKLKT